MTTRQLLLALVVVPLLACSGSKSDELVKTVAVSPGANCPFGGEAIETGFDTNGNGVLDPSEVTSTTYVCNGANADAGSNGASALVLTQTFGAGAGTAAENVACPGGGVQIESGIDLNGNGVLDPNEVTSTSYVCNGAGLDAGTRPTVIEGGYTIINEIDAAQFAGVTTLTGDLTINALGLGSVDLSALQTVGGNVYVSGFSGTTLSMPALTSIGSGLYVEGKGSGPCRTARGSDRNGCRSVARLTGGPQSSTLPLLETISAPLLVSIGGQLTVGDTTALATIDLPMLASVGGEFNFGSNEALLTLSFPSLTTNGTVSEDGGAKDNGGFYYYGDANGQADGGGDPLTEIDFPVLTAMNGDIDIESSASLTTFSAPLLASASGLYIQNNASLAALSLPSLASTLTDEFQIQSNNGLVSIDLSAMTNLSSQLQIMIENNNALTTLNFSGLVAMGDIESSEGQWVYIQQNPELASIDFSSLQSAVALQIESNQVLGSLSFPQLTVLDSIQISSNPSITSIQFPVLDDAQQLFQIDGNSSLTSVTAPKWISDPPANGFDVSNNPELPTCEVVSLANKVGLPSYSPSGDSSSCPDVRAR